MGNLLLLAPLLGGPITPWLSESITEAASSLHLIMKETAGLPLDTEGAAGLPPPPLVIVHPCRRKMRRLMSAPGSGIKLRPALGSGTGTGAAPW